MRRAQGGLATVLAAASLVVPLARATIPYVLLSQQHSGTHFMLSELRACPGVVHAGEAFGVKPDRPERCVPRDGWGGPPGSDGAGPTRLAVMDRFWGRKPFEPPRPTPRSAVRTFWELCMRRAYGTARFEQLEQADAYVRSGHVRGFLWHMNQGWWPLEPWVAPFRRRRVRVLLLARVNVIAHAMGASAKRRDGGSGEAAGAPALAELLRNMRQLAANLPRMGRAAATLRDGGVRAQLVVYERLLARPAEELAKVYRFLDADAGARALDASAVTCGGAIVNVSFGSKHHTQAPREYLTLADARRVLEQCRALRPVCRPCMLDDSCDPGSYAVPLPGARGASGGARHARR